MFRSARAPLVDEDPHQADLRNKSTSPTTTANTAITRKPVGAKPPPPLKNGALAYAQSQAQDSQYACPHCGGSGSRSGSRAIGLGINTQADDGTRRRIEDLEAEVRRLTGKASSAGMPILYFQSWHCRIPYTSLFQPPFSLKFIH